MLQCPYDSAKAKLIVKEMTDLLVLDMVEKHLVTDQLVLTIGYDIENLTNRETAGKYKGEVTTDRYGRKVPKHAHGTTNLNKPSSSTKQIMEAVLELYDRIVDKNLLVRRITVTANHLTDETAVNISSRETFVQIDLFTDYDALEQQKQEDDAKKKKERALQEAVLSVKKKFGKNAILKGISLEEGATGMERNNQIGGHRA